MKYILKFTAVALLFGLVAGCTTSVTKVSNKQTSEIIRSKHASYIVFSRPSQVGGANTNAIVEFLPGGEGLILITALGGSSRTIYKTIPGEHYFYMQGGENDDMLKIDAAPGKVYYVHTMVGMGLVAGRFYFKPMRYSSLNLKKTLLNTACDKATLNKYQFVSIDEDMNYTGTDSYESDQVGMKIQCKNSAIKSAEFTYPNFADINDVEIVELNETKDAYLKERSESYLNEISEDYPEWAENNFGGNMMTQDDGFPMKEAVKLYR